MAHDSRSLPARRLTGLPFSIGAIETPDQGERDESGLDRAGRVELLREILKGLRDGLQATETKLASHEGRFMDEREVIAWGARLKAISLMVEVLGAAAPRAVAPQLQVQVRYRRPSYLPPVVDHTPVESEVESRDVSVACNSNATEEETSLHVSSP